VSPLTDKLDALVNALLEHETLDQLDAYAAVGIDPPAAVVDGPLSAAATTASTS